MIRRHGNNIALTFWQFIAAILIQSALISWLLYEHWRRQRAEILARNTMSELTHVNRMATVGQLSASIAHEVRQPLAGIVGKRPSEHFAG